ncbi:zinc finger protein 2 homolog [Drosophila elegans]|uniref:zinc finger protein 2 homolog n=1 Tax=Drosophila elegans TaxID=30023 RepID=UPI0007E6BB99|nr:zinc finger protein 2 homolog [Drosophila elegans]
MFETKLNLGAAHMVADSTTLGIDGRDVTKTMICRACLVLLGPQDACYNLDSEQDLARKYYGCTGGDPGKKFRLQDEDLPPQLVLKSICECCYKLVQKFHDFQRMCEESSRNFEKLLLDIDFECLRQQEDTLKIPDLDTPSESNESTTNQEAQMNTACIESTEEIEEVLIIEDETANRDLENEKIPISSLRNVTGERKRRVRHTLKCNVCHRGFYKASLLEAHMKQHEGLKPYTCVLCGKSYARSNLLDAHLREVHHNNSGRVTYPCPACHKVYTADRSLKYHLKRAHERTCRIESPDSLHICEMCGKSFVRKALLTRHQRIHDEKEHRKYPCEFCDQKFYTKENMRDHLQRKHGNKNLLRCRKCGRIFSSRLSLSTHLTMHENYVVQ